MTSQELKNLKKEIEDKTNELNDLQDLCRKETGRNHIFMMWFGRSIKNG